MSRRAIDASELPDEVRRRIAKDLIQSEDPAPPTSDVFCHKVLDGRHVCRFAKGHGGECQPHMNLDSLPKKSRPKQSRGPRDDSAAARTRGLTGRNTEADFDATHAFYEMAKVGKIWPHSPPFIKAKSGWMPRAGGGPVDRTGHVCVRVRHTSGPFGHDNKRIVEACPITKYGPGCLILPVAFDIKAIGTEHATYQHPIDRSHQLHQLRDASATGVLAFLLVYVPQHERVCLLGIEHHFRDLISGRGVTLYETRAESLHLPGRREPFFLVPSVQRGESSISGVGQVPGFDWIPLLAWCDNDRNPLANA